MLRPLHSLILVTGVVSLIGCANSKEQNEGQYSQVHSDSGIRGRSYSDIVAELESLASSYPSMAKVITYGKSLGGADLTMIRIGKSGSFDNRPGVVIEGTIHGDEFLNIEDRLPRWFLENQTSSGVAEYLEKGGIIWIAPILNPDGYKARRRANNSGKDLNRDFDMKAAQKKGFTQPETKSLIDTLKRELSEQKATLKLTMDYHCCVGALIYPWGHSATAELPEPARSEHKRLAKMILGNFNGYRAGRAQEIVNYVAIGASDDFFHESMGATAFTFEGAYAREHLNFDRHTKMWDQLLADQAGKTSQQNNNTQQKPALALGKEDGSRFETHLGVSAEADGSYVLCEGSAVSCLGSSAKVVTTYQNGHRVGDRMIYKAASTVDISDGRYFTILKRGLSGSFEQSSAIQIKSR